MGYEKILRSFLIFLIFDYDGFFSGPSRSRQIENLVEVFREWKLELCKPSIKKSWSKRVFSGSRTSFKAWHEQLQRSVSYFYSDL